MYVTNKWNRPLVVDYGCQEIKFEVGKTVELEEVAVRHIFGYGAENKEPYMASLGIIKTTNDIPDGLEILARFVISDSSPQKNDVLSPVVERVPLPPKKAGGKSIQLAA